MIKGIIFDLDGTLLYTAGDLANAVNQTMKDFGYPTYSDKEIMAKVGHGFRNLIEQAMPDGVGDERIDEGLAKFLVYYDKCYMETTKPYPGVPEALKKLQDNGLKLSVNSNKRTDYSRSLITSNFPEINFVDILGSREGIPNKPDPTTANELIAMMGLDKSEVAYCGDSPTDIKTARNAGVKAVSVSWGFRPRADLEKNSPDEILDETKQLGELGD